MAKAKPLSKSQINKVLKRCLLMQSPELKRAALVLSFSTLRVSELAQITISDLLMPSGEVKSEIALRAALCKRRKPRTVWLSSQARQVLQEWIDYRIGRKWGVTSKTEYQGLNPASKVLYCNRGRSYSMKRKTRYSITGERVDYLACDVLELMLRTIYQRCGLNGCSSHTGRRSYASNMNNKGIGLRTIAAALGHSDEQVTLEYIDVSSQQLIEAAKMAL